MCLFRKKEDIEFGVKKLSKKDAENFCYMLDGEMYVKKGGLNAKKFVVMKLRNYEDDKDLIFLDYAVRKFFAYCVKNNYRNSVFYSEYFEELGYDYKVVSALINEIVKSFFEFNPSFHVVVSGVGPVEDVGDVVKKFKYTKDSFDAEKIEFCFKN